MPVWWPGSQHDSGLPAHLGDRPKASGGPVADEQRQSWWRSVPGHLTAASGFIAALSGLVAGLNQLGVFRREPPAAQQVVGIAPRRATARPILRRRLRRGRLEHRSGPDDHNRAAGPSTPGRRPAAPRRGHVAVEARAAGAPPPRDTVKCWTRQPPLPSASRRARARAGGAGADLRACGRPAALHGAAGDAGKVGAATVLPANTTAVLQVRRAGSPAAPQVRLDSLGRADADAVPPSQARLRPDAANGTCLRADARIMVTLGAAMTVGRR